MRSKGETPEKELQDAIERIGKKPEAISSTKNSDVWQKYLINVLGVNPASVKSDKGQDFWDRVRIGLEPIKLEPIKIEPWAPFVNPRTGQLSYRSTITGRFISRTAIGLPPLAK